MKAYRLFLVAALLVVGLVGVIPGAQASDLLYFTSVESSCSQGSYAGVYARPVQPLAAQAQFPTLRVEVWDSAGNFLGSKIHTTLSGPFDGVITYSQQPEGDVTFMLYWIEDGEVLHDTRTVTPDCALNIPGCDVLISIPAGSVGGTFNETFVAFYEPFNITAPEAVIPVGASAWIIGLDETEEFYKFLWVCQFLWAPRGVVGPNFDEVWMGAPLPTQIVE